MHATPTAGSGDCPGGSGLATPQLHLHPSRPCTSSVWTQTRKCAPSIDDNSSSRSPLQLLRPRLLRRPLLCGAVRCGMVQVTRIKELIQGERPTRGDSGGPAGSGANGSMYGRWAGKTFLFDIVANKRNG